MKFLKLNDISDNRKEWTISLDEQEDKNINCKKCNLKLTNYQSCFYCKKEDNFICIKCNLNYKSRDLCFIGSEIDHFHHKIKLEYS